MFTTVSLMFSLDDDGIDIIFLNREGKKKVNNWKEAEKLFKSSPSGTTPLTAACRQAFSRQKGKPLLCLVATDGAPNNLRDFTSLIKNRDSNMIFLSFLACSDNHRDVEYLNQMDRSVRHLDVIDDYKNERKEVMRKLGPVDYTLGDHVARFLLGSVYEKYDKLDGF